MADQEWQSSQGAQPDPPSTSIPAPFSSQQGGFGSNPANSSGPLAPSSSQQGGFGSNPANSSGLPAPSSSQSGASDPNLSASANGESKSGFELQKITFKNYKGGEGLPSQSFWHKLTSEQQANVLVQPLGESTVQWTKLIRGLELIRNKQGKKLNGNAELDDFVKSGVWDVSSPGFDLSIFKNDKGWDVISKVLLDEITHYREKGLFKWTASEYDQAAEIIQQVLQGTSSIRFLSFHH
jgi:hypothetical protein